mgnify:CR=1 FL=1
MKRELKYLAGANLTRAQLIEEPFPMKRELKAWNREEFKKLVQSIGSNGLSVWLSKAKRPDNLSVRSLR